MNKIKMFMLGAAFLLCGIAFGNESNTTKQSSKVVRPVEITLVPITENRVWKKEFTAIIQNNSSTSITIVHPRSCWLENAKQMSIKDFYGKSEILLNVRTPKGKDLILRERLTSSGFDPSFKASLNIAPGKSESFRVWMFFETPMAKWKNDILAAKIFDDIGKYKVSILYRNVYPNAIWNLKDEDGLKHKVKRITNAWTGELESNEVTVEVK